MDIRKIYEFIRENMTKITDNNRITSTYDCEYYWCIFEEHFIIFKSEGSEGRLQFNTIEQVITKEGSSISLAEI